MFFKCAGTKASCPGCFFLILPARTGLDLLGFHEKREPKVIVRYRCEFKLLRANIFRSSLPQFLSGQRFSIRDPAKADCVNAETLPYVLNSHAESIWRPEIVAVLEQHIACLLVREHAYSLRLSISLRLHSHAP